MELALATLLVILALLLFGRSWGRIGGVALLLLAVAWLRLNKPLEGPTLIYFSHDRGFTLADTLVVAMLAVAGWRILSASRSERPKPAKLSVSEPA